jgi:heme/copper-type cytochrome/quinol oxidase subunit 2
VVEASSASAPLFTYAAVIDNATADSSFVAGAEDLLSPVGPVATATPPLPQATPTPTRTPTRTPTPTPPSAPATVVNLTAQQFRWSFNGGGTSFVMQVGQTYELRMRTLDVTHGFSGLPEIGLSGAALSPGSAVIVQTVRPTSAQVGSHVFVCDIECGVGHGFAGTIQITQ